MKSQDADLQSILAAPEKSGPLRILWIGLIMIVVSFGIKQIIVSFAMSNLGTSLEEPRLQAERAAELATVDDREDRDRVYEKYTKRIEEARKETAHAGASAISKLQWFCNLKIILDLLRFIGSVLVLFASFRVVTSSEHDTPTKTLAVVLCGFSLLTMTLGGLLTLVS